jgi:dehydrogenase/reductase SDR family member 1
VDYGARHGGHGKRAGPAGAEAVTRAGGRLDLLVNNVWGGYERLNAGAWEEWNAPLWDQPLELFDAMFIAGVRAHYVALAGAPGCSSPQRAAWR